MNKEEYKKIIQKHNLKTPCYVFEEDELISRVNKIRKSLDKVQGELCYAIKANPFLLPYLDSYISKYEVCSPGELEICRYHKIPGEKIVFSGVVKSYEDIVNALLYTVDVITIESMRHWELLKKAVHETGVNTKILLRLTSGAQFGMEEEEIRYILEEQKNIAKIDFGGIHYFTGTQKKGTQYEKELDFITEFMQNLQKEYKIGQMTLEYGPGLAVPYFINDNLEQDIALIENMVEYVENKNIPYPLVVELGRYIAATCGSYITKIVDKKKACERNYCLIDGGIHHLNYYGQNMAMRTPVIEHISHKEGNGEVVEYMICGSLCTFADILVRGLPLEDAEIDDTLVFKNCGAYSVTEASYLFLSRDMPMIYSYQEKTGLRIIRNTISTWKINVGNGVN